MNHKVFSVFDSLILIFSFLNKWWHSALFHVFLSCSSEVVGFFNYVLACKTIELRVHFLFQIKLLMLCLLENRFSTFLHMSVCFYHLFFSEILGMILHRWGLARPHWPLCTNTHTQNRQWKCPFVEKQLHSTTWGKNLSRKLFFLHFLYIQEVALGNAENNNNTLFDLLFKVNLTRYITQ